MKPYRQATTLQRLVRRTAANRPMARVYGVVQQPIDTLVHRFSHGDTTASSVLAGVEILMLTTTGAKSGRPRTTPLLGLPDGPDIIVIASNFGRPHNPSWYYNLRADPHATITIGGATRSVIARELTGEERDRCYHRGEEVFPGFTHYRDWAANRSIPVLKLQPA